MRAVGSRRRQAVSGGWLGVWHDDSFASPAPGQKPELECKLMKLIFVGIDRRDRLLGAEA